MNRFKPAKQTLIAGSFLLALVVSLFTIGCGSREISEVDTISYTSGGDIRTKKEEVAIATASIAKTTTASITNNSSNLTYVTVEEVVDGDTVKILEDGVIKKVRLIGIDTPETKNPRTGIECGGPEAAARLSTLISGKQIALETDATQGDLDKYDRLLRYVWLDEININQLLIAEGLAYEYTYNKTYKYRDEFVTAQTIAAQNRIGLWAPEGCNELSPR